MYCFPVNKRSPSHLSVKGEVCRGTTFIMQETVSLSHLFLCTSHFPLTQDLRESLLPVSVLHFRPSASRLQSYLLLRPSETIFQPADIPLCQGIQHTPLLPRLCYGTYYNYIFYGCQDGIQKFHRYFNNWLLFPTFTADWSKYIPNNPQGQYPALYIPGF